MKSLAIPSAFSRHSKAKPVLERALRAQARMEWAKNVLREVEERRTNIESELRAVAAAKDILSESVRTVMTEATLRVNELGTLALRSVMEEDSSLLVELTERRGRIEADVFIEKDGNRVRPMEASAGGEVDLIALALQVSFWALGRKTRPVMVLDEPLKYLKGGDLPTKGAEFMERLSKDLGIQFIIVSHVQEQLSKAHLIKVRKRPDGTSFVEGSHDEKQVQTSIRGRHDSG